MALTIKLAPVQVMQMSVLLEQIVCQRPADVGLPYALLEVHTSWTNGSMDQWQLCEKVAVAASAKQAR